MQVVHFLSHVLVLLLLFGPICSEGEVVHPQLIELLLNEEDPLDRLGLALVLIFPLLQHLLEFLVLYKHLAELLPLPTRVLFNHFYLLLELRDFAVGVDSPLKNYELLLGVFQ